MNSPIQDGLSGPRNKAEIIANILRDDIVSGKFPVGSKLPAESELIQRFGVSRPSFREALRILESERLISVARGSRGGAVVKRPELEPIARGIGVLLQLQGATIEDIFRARALIEPELVRAIAAAPREDVLGALAQCAAAQRFSVGNLADFKREELQFRRLLIAHGSSITLSCMAALLSDVIERKLLGLPPVDPSAEARAELAQGVRAKERLIALIEAADAPAAEQLWRDYLDEYSDRIMVRIGEPNSIAPTTG